MKLKLKEIMNNTSNNRILMGAMLLILGCFLLINISTGDTYAVITGYSCETGTVGTFAPTYLSGLQMIEQVHYDNHCLMVADTKTCYIVSNGTSALTETCSQYDYTYSCTFVESKVYNQQWKKCTRGTDVQYCNVQSATGCGSYENSGYTCDWALADVYSCTQYIDYGEATPIESEKVCYQCIGNSNIKQWGSTEPNLSSNCSAGWTIKADIEETNCVSTYTVVYNANGGSGAPTSQTKTEGVILTLHKSEPSWDGHTFVGWNTKQDGTGTSYQPGDSYTSNMTITLYAQWKVNSGGGTVTPTTYTVSFDANGGSGAPASQTKTANVELTLSSTKPTWDGHTFVEWNTKSDGTGTVYQSGGKYTTDSSVTLYAQWKENSDDSGTTDEDKIYNIKYNLNGGVGTGNPSTAKYDETVTINNPTKTVTVTGNDNKTGAIIGNPVNVNLVFDGWTSSDLDTKTAYYGSTAWTNGKTKVTATSFKNLTAVGKTVTLEANWKSKEISLPTVSKEGYSCVWNTKSDGTGDKYYSGAKYTVLGNVSSVNLYAVCEVNSKVDEEIDKGPGTGDALIYAVWGIGVGALGYCVYYFRKKKLDM